MILGLKLSWCPFVFIELYTGFMPSFLLVHAIRTSHSRFTITYYSRNVVKDTGFDTKFHLP